MRRLVFALALACAAPLFAPTDANAQYSDELRQRARRSSSELFLFELKIGTYRTSGDAVGGGNAGYRYFRGDKGPLVQLEFDALPLRIPYVGTVGLGASFGWVRYRARACLDIDCEPGDENRADNKIKLRAFPIAPMAVLRIDVLAREAGIPLVFTGRIGLDMFIYDVSGNGGGNGTTFGLRWAAQAALELDFINPRRARSLDEEWGINHTYLLFEMFGSTAEMADPIAWTAGLGMSF
ncbi:MAG: hypothetical protein H6720_04335 [Sandaracinus sp.]|nr:hypothetical protein [Sandaracinus sp.]MCB9624430.1 hypothetical protein [Sandaracinus sp.]